VCPPSYNPAEFFIQKLSVVPGEDEEEANSQRMEQLFEAFRASEEEEEEEEESLQQSVPHIHVAHNSITEVRYRRK
jgi:hypothetical protein